MNAYYPWLVTLDYVRTHRNMLSTETGDDDVLTNLIEEASGQVITQLNRIPVPYVATKLYDYSASNVRGRVLKFNDDLLAMTTLTNGDTTTVTSANYKLYPLNDYPKSEVALTTSSSLYWTYTGTPEGAISVAGIWGYVPHYALSAWKDSAQDIPAGNLTAAATSVVLTAVTVFEVGDYIKVNSEVMQITAIDTSTETLTLLRAQLGTTAAAHTSGDAILIFQQLPDIRRAVREIVVYMYLTRDRIGNRVNVYEGGVMTVEQIDPEVDKIIRRHQRIIFSGVRA